jgi:hypothetical protein
MTDWVWVPIGAAALIAVSLVVGLALARILGTISAAASRLLDEELWASAPLTRWIGPSANDQPVRHARRPLGLQAPE